uniref:Uncharacterized protein AlNc14C171G8012 n=1 Tax=Albugo laibachii Nc14 TaxID=890382 RepID=F0WEJ7_9STRA|nr:conserved hypothetical protein [Albugo laibachii Nc14]CCA22879.1 conserved hypothetical protein [Albugo laibachii Nc14]|eukprot:CCA22879.1 conserved hypothetical protein [Albugo laibachii Nc14]
MKLGFSLKKVRKNGFQVQRIDDRGSDTSSMKQAFASMEKKTIPNEIYITKFDASSSAPSKPAELIIPLIKENQWTKKLVKEACDVPLKDSASTESNAINGEAEAAKAILAEIEERNNSSSLENTKDSKLVIAMRTDTRVSDENLSETKIGRREELHDSRPILFQNAIPGMEKLDSVAAKYQFDVSMRPQELHVHSDAYEKVPVEEFGLALLRGMGWKGTKDDETHTIDIQPRHRLLGLGAKSAPELSVNHRTKRKKIAHAVHGPVTMNRDRPPSSTKKLSSTHSSDVKAKSKENNRNRNERNGSRGSIGQRSNRSSDREHRRDDEKRRENRNRSGNRRITDNRK